VITLFKTGAYLADGAELIADDADAAAKLKRLGKAANRESARKGTITHGILSAHNSGSERELKITFDSLASHDITYVGIIQTARASGMTRFPLPYVLTNCHNSLCAVGGTINEDDHVFALSAAKKYGGIYVPPHLAVIHSYNRELMAGCGKMILGSDSHTRYGALGAMGVGEGGGELAKQLVGRTYDLSYPDVVAVYLTGTPRAGVGPQDAALAIIGAVFRNGYAKNKALEFVGDGVARLPVDFRNGIDVMTTETACWSSVWRTDGAVRDYLAAHGRAAEYRELAPKDVAYYEGAVVVDLSKVEPSIALPFHPSNVYTIRELAANAADIFAQVEKDARETLGAQGVALNLGAKLKGGSIQVEQAVIAGCSGGTFDNLSAAAGILDGKSTGNGAFSLSVYPDSQPTFAALVRSGAVSKLVAAGAVVRSAFCGPCFGAGDTPANGALSIRHTTRNFPNREGSKPGEGQLAAVALMDARSIAATAANGGRLTAADEAACGTKPAPARFFFDRSIYDKRVYDGTGRAEPDEPLVFGPNIKDWPQIPALPDSLLVKVVSYLTDPVITTDELIPSGETSSYRSNPLRLAEFTLSRKDPAYVGRAKAVQAQESARQAGGEPDAELQAAYRKLAAVAVGEPAGAAIGSAVYAYKIGDGSAREQAASCQRVLGAAANFAREYATKRYRSNLLNWGILPFLVADEGALRLGDYVFLPGIRQAVLGKADEIRGYAVRDGAGGVAEIVLALGALTDAEREILAAGCLINHYRAE
jgi:aconitate hydratase